VGRAGPWRSSGAWWTLVAAGWDRDEWDLELADGAVYRLSRNRVSGSWDIEGLFD
jgi:protein ImuB